MEPDPRWIHNAGSPQPIEGNSPADVARKVSAFATAGQSSSGQPTWYEYEYLEGSCEDVPPDNTFGPYALIGQKSTYSSVWQIVAYRCTQKVYSTNGTTRNFIHVGPYAGSMLGSFTCPKWPDGNSRASGKFGSDGVHSEDGPDFFCVLPAKDRCETDARAGNPISAIFANKIETVQLGVASLSMQYQGEGTATTRRLGRRWTHSFDQTLAVFEMSTASVAVSSPVIHSMRDDGTHWRFPSSTNEVTATGFSQAKLLKTATGYRLTLPDDNVEIYTATGRLQSITTRAGVVQTLTYNANNQLTTVTDSYGRTLSFTYYASNAATSANNIATVTDHLGNVVSYTYDVANNLSTVTYPGGGVKTYLYNEQAYTANTNLPNAMTGIIDENGTRFATYQYDSQGRAISTEHAGGVEKYQLNYVSPYAQTVVTDPLGTARTFNFQTILGVVKTTGVSQPCPTCGGSSAQATTYDTNGNVASRTDFNNKKTCYAYDLSRNLETTRIDGLLSSESCTTGLTTPPNRADVRKTSTAWHATYRLPLTITEPAAAATVGGAAGTKTTVLSYDASGNLLQKDVTAPKNDGTAATELRTWKWTYNALGQVLTAKDPLNQTTTTVYYPATDTAVPPKFTTGDVQTVTNALSHIVTFNEYDKNGRLLKTTDANGLITTMSYHPRGWLTSRSVNNGATTETTTYTYDNVGQLISVVTPDGVPLNYTYDAAHRLIRVWDESSYVSSGNRLGNGSLGNRIDYVLDNMGNRISESHFDPNGALQKQKTRVINSLNRLQQDIGGTTYATAPTSAITQYGYDNNGNVTTTTDPLGRVTTNGYDALNRLLSVIDPYNGAAKPTTYLYDQAGNLTKVTDPQGLETTYTYNGHNNLITQQSPDTGTTKFAYNAAGNLTTKLDAAGRCTVTAYDNLNRASTVKHIASATPATCIPTTTATAAETVSYTYDSITATVGGAGGKGRLGQLTDGTGNTKYVYDKNGRVVSKAQTTTGATNATRTVSYTYNANGQLVSMVTPSGQTIGYLYNSSSNNGISAAGYLGRISAITVNGVYVIGFAQYQAFGPVSGWAWGNHQAPAPGGGAYPSNLHSRLYDLDHRPTAIFSDPEGYNRNINWDQANRITGITVPSGLTLPGISNAGSLNQAFAYDTLDRLTTFNAGLTGATNAATGLGLLPTETFTYDGIGNRKTRTTQAPGATSTQSTSYVHGNATPANHWLTGLTGANAWTYAYDASGNTLKEGVNVANAATTQYTLTYDAKNRLNKTQIGSNTANVINYKINALGQRVQKTGAGTYAFNAATPASFAYNARFDYDESGNLMGEYAPDGKLISETIWFNDLPVATLRPKGSNSGLPLGITGTGATQANNVGNNTTANKVNVDVYYLHPDHLGTPRVMTRSAPVNGATSGPNAVNKQVWSWNSDPFGTTALSSTGGSANSAPNKNPQLVTGTPAQIAAASFEQNLRMPGQYEDQETKKFYNGYRTYDPTRGQYDSSDPIGLEAGLSTFAYVDNAPLMYRDPLGLQLVLPPGNLGAASGGLFGACCRKQPNGGRSDLPTDATGVPPSVGAPPIWNTPAPPSNGDIIGGAPVPAFPDLMSLKDCTVGRQMVEPALGKRYKGGVSIQQEYFCPCGQITRHTIIVGGVIVHDHFRPGSPRPGGD